MLTIKVFDGDVLLGRGDHTAGSVSIGRDPGSNVPIDHESISRTHANLTWRDGKVFLETRAGVLLNGSPVTRTVQVIDGDRLTVGRFTLVLVLERGEEKLADVPAPAAQKSATTADKSAPPLPDPAREPAPAAPATPARPSARLAAAAERVPAHRLVELLVRLEKDPDALGRLREPLLVSCSSLSLAEAEESVVHELGAAKASRSSSSSGRLTGELERLTIGRARENDVVITDPSVSKRHASLVRRDGGLWTVVDEGSSNGTCVEGTPVERGRPIDLPGNLVAVRFGDCRYTFMRLEGFAGYLRSLKDARRVVQSRPTRVHRALSPAPQPVPAPTEPTRLRPVRKLKDAILGQIEASGLLARSYKVEVAGGLQDFASWEELAEFLEHAAPFVISVAVLPRADEPAKVVYLRA